MAAVELTVLPPDVLQPNGRFCDSPPEGVPECKCPQPQNCTRTWLFALLQRQPGKKLSRTERTWLSTLLSTSTTLCHVPSCGTPPSTGSVSDGANTLQIVCGAPNARAGIKVVLARPGTVIPATGDALTTAITQLHNDQASTAKTIRADEEAIQTAITNDSGVKAAQAQLQHRLDLIILLLHVDDGRGAVVVGLGQEVAELARQQRAGEQAVEAEIDVRGGSVPLPGMVVWVMMPGSKCCWSHWVLFAYGWMTASNDWS